MKRIVCLVTALLFVLALACAGAVAEEAPIKVTSLKLNKSSYSTQPGKSFTLKATVKPSGAEVTWKSSNETVATVNENGVVSTLSDGKTVVTASAGAKTARCTITVKTVNVTSVKLNATKVTVHPGYTYALKATIKPSNATYKTLTWQSENPLIAQVEDGVITARPGALGQSTRIIATAHNGKRAVCTVTVDNVYVNKIKLNKTKATIALNRSLQLTATVQPLTAGDRTVTWTSSKPSVATVNEDGLVNMVGEGSAVITATANDGSGKKASCKVTSKVVRVSSVKASESVLTLDPGESDKLSFTVSPTNASFPQGTWSSADESIARVDENGKVTGVASGVTTVKVTVDGGRKSASCTVRVRSANPKTFRLSTVGDVIVGGDPRAGTDDTFVKYLKKYTAEGKTMLMKVAPYFLSDDVTLANLECALTNRSSSLTKEDKTYMFRGKPAYAQILADGGFDHFNLANNHTGDYGSGGYNDTRNALKKYGMTYNGGGYDNAKTMTINGIKVGFIGYQTPQSQSTVRNGIKKLKAKCDVVIVSFHWCDVKEYTFNSTGSQRTMARAAVNAGADLVVGHHPHVLSGIEKYKGKYIVYGLGNFLVAGVNPIRGRDTFIFQQTFAVHEDFVEAVDVKVIPCWSTSSNKTNDRMPEPIPKSDSRYEKIMSMIRKYSPNNAASVDPGVLD